MVEHVIPGCDVDNEGCGTRPTSCFPFVFGCPPSRTHFVKGCCLACRKPPCPLSLGEAAACDLVVSMFFGLAQKKEGERSLAQDRSIAVNLQLICAPCDKRLKEPHSILTTDGTCSSVILMSSVSSRKRISAVTRVWF